MNDGRRMNSTTGNRRPESLAMQPWTNRLNSVNPSFLHSKMGRMRRMLLALPASQYWCWDEIKYYWKGHCESWTSQCMVVVVETVKKWVVFSQPRGNQFTSIYSYSLALSLLWLMVQFCKSASQYSSWKKCLDKVYSWFRMQTEANSRPDRWIQENR